jgi:hypothetical protein
MMCPKRCGEMEVYEARIMTRKYLCTNKACNVRLDLNTHTGEVVQVASGIAAVGAVVMWVFSAILGGDGDSGNA